MELLKQHTKKLTTAEIKTLFPLVNGDRDWKISLESHHLIDKIIELWFESQGYDFWHNPFPDVVEWTLTKEKEIEFIYILQK